MRTDNRKVKNTILSIYFILVVTAIMLATVFGSMQLFAGSSIYVLLGLIVAMVLVNFIARFFEYDSDGPNLVIINKGLILTEYVNYRENKMEFPKRKLFGFKIYNYLFYKTLVIVKKNGDGSITKERFNITLLKRKKLRYIKQSLRKILKENLKHKEG